MRDADVNPAAEKSTRVYDTSPVHRDRHAEGSVTRMLEQQTAKVPSHWFLAGWVGSLLLGVGLEIRGKKRWSRLIGLWAPSLLLMGIYNKLVKTLGSR